MKTRINYALSLLSGEPLKAIEALDRNTLESIDEIRLRAGRPVSVSVGREDMILNANASIEDIEHAFKAAFSYSMHSYSKELAMGCVTSRGGNRVGVCGTAAVGADKRSVESLKYISSVNIRIARELIGCADEIVKTCFGGGLCGAIIVGPPSSGKTTVLRDISRRLGNRYKISLIDELNEISATYCNAAQNDVGRLTDVFVGYPKSFGISTAVRVMSPRAIIADEIGSEEDGAALFSALHSGVKLITAVHGESFEDTAKKPVVKRLIENGAFSWAIELDFERKPRAIKID